MHPCSLSRPRGDRVTKEIVTREKNNMARLKLRGMKFCVCLSKSIRSLHTGLRSFDKHKCVEVSEVGSFIERCMKSVGTPDQHCRALSQVLVAGDVRGHFSHGLNRLGERCLKHNHRQT